MSGPAARSVVTSWFGVFLFEGDALVIARPFPSDRAVLAERLGRRREGRLAPEEEALLSESADHPLTSRDRRLARAGVRFASGEEGSIRPEDYGFDRATFRELLLERAAVDLSEGWDPTIHVQEAVRAVSELDRALNALGERLASWAEHDRPAPGESEGAQHRLAEELSEEEAATPFGVPPADPELGRGRRELAELYLTTERTRAELERALTSAMPTTAPNLTALLGPLLAARMISQAGSLDRLARLPASTVQVLGAEKAFFEHLRGRAPPPRHGLLFTHPALQSAPRAQRGRIARALAGKVAIAARLDRAGRPVDPELARVFQARAEEIRRSPRRPRTVPRGSKRPRPST